MKTDRELLELAAKAAGLGVKWEQAHSCFWIEMGQGLPINHWNPLKDDGDALRLSVKTGESFVVRTRCVTTMGGLMENFDPNTPGDDLRATRRVIVRAAAAFQKSKEPA